MATGEFVKADIVSVVDQFTNQFRVQNVDQRTKPSAA